MWLGFALRLVVAVWNGFFGPSFGAESDALHFHQVAADFSRTLTPDPFQISFMYSYMLGVIYLVTTDSLFIGSVVSCVAWLVSALFLMKTMRLLSFGRRQQLDAMLVFALLPSSILWTSVTLREPFQLLFVQLALYASLKIHLAKSTRHWVWLIAAAVCGGLLHATVFAFGVFLIVATSFWIVRRKRRKWLLPSLIVVVPFAAFALSYGFSLFKDIYLYRLDEGFAAAIEFFQRVALSTEARTNYKANVTITGLADLLQFMLVSLLQYLFEPMPWRISSPVDIVFTFENVLRGVLIWKALGAMRKAPHRQRRAVQLVFLSYVVIETVWSLGTLNWGTAARHHIPSGGLLVIAGFARARRTKRAHAAGPIAVAETPRIDSAILDAGGLAQKADG